MNNIFENAKFGDCFLTRDGRKAIYHGFKKHKSGNGKVWVYHYLMLEPKTINILGEDIIINLYEAYINDNGVGRFANLKYYKDSGANAECDIVSEWQEPINEEELDKQVNVQNRFRLLSTQQLKSIWKEGFKVGYRKAKIDNYEKRRN